jgi:hypothetical protein
MSPLEIDECTTKSPPFGAVHRPLPRRHLLIVNGYFDDSRQPIHRTTKLPQAVGPTYLAGAFARELCEVRCYTELASGHSNTGFVRHRTNDGSRKIERENA